MKVWWVICRLQSWDVLWIVQEGYGLKGETVLVPGCFGAHQLCSADQRATVRRWSVHHLSTALHSLDSTLITVLQAYFKLHGLCVGAVLELISAGLRPSRNRVWHPCSSRYIFLFSGSSNMHRWCLSAVLNVAMMETDLPSNCIKCNSLNTDGRECDWKRYV